MAFIPGYYKSQTCLNSVNILHRESSSTLKNATESLGKLTMSSKLSVDKAEAKALAACKSHSEAERRRRKRINGHFATLRKLLPNTIKTDKASLLAEVVRHVKELKKTTTEIAASRPAQIPSETDDLNVSYTDHGGDIQSTIKASISCDDRPELIPELRKALTKIHAKVVRIEMATVGRRIICVLWVQISSVSTRDEGLRVLRQALYVVIDRATLLPSLGSERPCLSHN